MAHDVDGFDLSFTSRTSWKAEVRRNGEVVDVVPVTWTKGWQRRGNENYLEVWFRNADELTTYSKRTEPFLVAIAKAHDYEQFPHVFAFFTALFRVVATGAILSDISIETRVLERVSAR